MLLIRLRQDLSYDLFLLSVSDYVTKHVSAHGPSDPTQVPGQS